MQGLGPGDLHREVLETGLCVGCGACIHLCPYFDTWQGKTAMVFSCDREKGRCHAFCPKTEVDLDALSRLAGRGEYTGEPLGAYQQIFAARAGAAAVRGDFQDGGTVSALVAYALETGRIDAAVLTGKKGLMPEPALVTRARDVAGYGGSGYAAAPTLAALNQGVSQGYQQMGVVGTPCQMTAVARMRANPMADENFSDPVALTIGLFCTWALDARGLMAFMEKRLPGEEIRKIRIPPPPAEILVAETPTRAIEIALDEIRDLVLQGCGLCPDMTAEWADVSVGTMEQNPGYNTLVVRTEKGRQLTADAAAAGYLEVWDFPQSGRVHLERAAAAKKRRAFGRALDTGRVNSEKIGSAVLRVNTRALEKMTAGPGGAHE
jgi:coenzyme F420 hydrogenase subunit beta